MKRASHLTPGEFELMEILWPLGEGSVREVWERVSPERSLAYTTVMTILEKLRRKGALRQRKRGKAFLYSPALTREAALTGVIDHVAHTYFQDSREALGRFVRREAEPALPVAVRSPVEDIDEVLL